MTQKHAIWFVPNYDNAGSTSGVLHPLTYLRLGSTTSTVTELDGTSASAKKLRGDDMLETAGLATDTCAWFEDDAASTNGDIDRNHSGAGTTFKRYSGAATTTSSAASLTGEAYTRGGWRDHTDGNRISTTRGDRIDYVQGNYKRVIFGRVSNTVAGVISQSTWESSGGHNHDTTSTPGEVTTITWVTEQGGTWKVIEQTAKGNQVERFSGEKEEYFDGGSNLETYIGEDGGGDRKNPKIKSRTYAKSITSTTEANSTEDDVDSTNTNSVTYVHGSLTDHTYADEISSFALAGIANGNTNTVTHEDVTGYGNRFVISVIGATVSLNVVAWDFTQTGNRLVPYPFETPPETGFKIAIGIKLAASLDMFVGAQVAANIGIAKLGVSIGNEITATFGVKAELDLAPVIDNNIKQTWAKVAEWHSMLADIDVNLQRERLAAYNGQG